MSDTRAFSIITRHTLAQQVVADTSFSLEVLEARSFVHPLVQRGEQWSRLDEGQQMLALILEMPDVGRVIIYRYKVTVELTPGANTSPVMERLREIFTEYFSAVERPHVSATEG